MKWRNLIGDVQKGFALSFKKRCKKREKTANKIV